jgi:hypothetical protein
VFKGFNAEQKKEILQTQEFQRQEHLKKLEKEKNFEQDWAVRDMASRRVLELLDREKNRKSKEMAIQIRKENEMKALEDKKRYCVTNHRREFMDKVLYTNPPQEDYFNQFNTTSR